MRSAIKNFLGGSDKHSSSTDSSHYSAATGTTGTTLAPAVVTTDLDVKQQRLDRAEVVSETIKPIEVREVQPVVDVHREQTEVHQVLQPVAARQELPLQVHEQVAPLQSYERREVAPAETLRDLNSGLQVQGSRTVEGVSTTVVEKAPIVNEHIHKTIVEEIQPVIYKETIEPHLIHQTVPIVEKVVEAPILIKEVRPIVPASGLSAPLTGHTILPK